MGPTARSRAADAGSSASHSPPRSAVAYCGYARWNIPGQAGRGIHARSMASPTPQSYHSANQPKGTHGCPRYLEPPRWIFKAARLDLHRSCSLRFVGLGVGLIPMLSEEGEVRKGDEGSQEQEDAARSSGVRKDAKPQRIHCNNVNGSRWYGQCRRSGIPAGPTLCVNADLAPWKEASWMLGLWRRRSGSLVVCMLCGSVYGIAGGFDAVDHKRNGHGRAAEAMRWDNCTFDKLRTNARHPTGTWGWRWGG